MNEQQEQDLRAIVRDELAMQAKPDYTALVREHLQDQPWFDELIQSEMVRAMEDVPRPKMNLDPAELRTAIERVITSPTVIDVFEQIVRRTVENMSFSTKAARTQQWPAAKIQQDAYMQMTAEYEARGVAMTSAPTLSMTTTGTTTPPNHQAYLNIRSGRY